MNDENKLFELIVRDYFSEQYIGYLVVSTDVIAAREKFLKSDKFSQGMKILSVLEVDTDMVYKIG